MERGERYRSIVGEGIDGREEDGHAMDEKRGMHDDHKPTRGCMDGTWEWERKERRVWCGIVGRCTVDLRVSLPWNGSIHPQGIGGRIRSSRPRQGVSRPPIHARVILGPHSGARA